VGLGSFVKKLTDSVGLTDDSGEDALKEAVKTRELEAEKSRKEAELKKKKEDIDKQKELGKVALETERMAIGGTGGGNMFQIGKGTGGQLR
jgi:predicted Holliday junction resolvase-like endonuclease